MSNFSLKSALAAWSPMAFDLLKKVAESYHATITYEDLANDLQTASGVATKMPLHYWIGDLLDVVADICKERNAPLLTSLVVSKETQEVSGGYAKAVYDVYGFTPDDQEEHASHEREKCYAAFCADIPEDAAPAFTPKVRLKRQRALAARKRPVCPTCHMQLPRTGVCDSCD